MVSNMDESIRFYTEVAGLKVKDRNAHVNGLEVAFLGYGIENETEIEFIQGFKDHLPPEGKVHHVALAVVDIQAEWDRVKQLGVEFIDQEIATMPNGIRYFFFYGPDKEWIEFFQRV
jgi:lactoylglutathione lyase